MSAEARTLQHIRPLHETDQGQWQDLFADYRREHGLERDDTIADAVLKFVTRMYSTSRGYVAMSRGRQTGFILCQEVLNPLDATTTLVVTGLFGRADYRDKGYQREQIEKAKEVTGLVQATQILWMVNGDSPTRTTYDHGLELRGAVYGTDV
jgi:hypothetical protein